MRLLWECNHLTERHNLEMPHTATIRCPRRPPVGRPYGLMPSRKLILGFFNDRIRQLLGYNCTANVTLVRYFIDSRPVHKCNVRIL